MRSFQELHQKYSIRKLIKKLDDRYGFQALIRSLTGHWFNPFATLYINFFSFPFRQAIKFPMFVYGTPGLYHVVGDMRIIGKVKTGMIEFNKANSLNAPHQLANSELSNLGTIIFHGKARIGCASRLLVQKNALLELGANVIIGDNVNLGCHQYISIGEQTRITHRCQIQESNHHFIANMSTRTVKPCTRPISIGRGCWICNSTTLTAGATIPDFCIVASNSLVNGGKNTANVPAGSIIGGIPAKVLSSNENYRIFNPKWEGRLFQWFAQNKNDQYILPQDISVEELVHVSYES